ncbi:MAG: hypothetical protein HQK81_08605 [Desulfovibrionaceae bacterium]|nr:hypothetical protein [Desulfovibrionaceae bacterium]MBF0514110.1 hypothetical protein [Desulfovibrionaceae bacterium]
MPLLLCLSLLGMFLQTSRLLRTSFASAPLFVFSLIPCALFVFGLLGWLQGGYYLLTLAGLLGLALELGGAPGRLRLARLCGDPVFLVFAALGAFFWWKFHGGLYYFNDFQTHWGPAVQELAERDVLRGIDTLVSLRSQDYPPGTALFAYYITKFTGYAPGMAYFAQDLMLCAAGCVILQNIKRKDWPLCLCLAAGYLFFLADLNWNGGSTGLYLLFADPVLGAWLGAAVALRIGRREYSARSVLYYAPVLFALPLFKKPGLLFAVIAWAFIFLDFLLAALRRRRLAPENRARSGPGLALLALAGLLLLAPFAAQESWQGRVRRADLNRTFPVAVSAGRLWNSFRDATASERDRSTREAFLNMYLKPGMFAFWGNELGMGGFTAAAALAALGVVLALRGSRERPRALTAFTVIFAGLAIYLFGLLVMYLYVFSDNEAKILSAVWRYISTYNLALGVVVLGYLGFFAGRRGWRASAAAICIWLLTLYCGLNATQVTWAFVFEPLPKG